MEIIDATAPRGPCAPGIKNGVIVDASYWLWIDAQRKKGGPALYPKEKWS